MAIRKCKSVHISHLFRIFAFNNHYPLQLPTLLKHNDNDQIEHDSDTNSTLSIPDFPFEEDYSRFIFFPIRYRAVSEPSINIYSPNHHRLDMAII